MASTSNVAISNLRARYTQHLPSRLTNLHRTHHSQPVPADLVKTIIHGTVTFIKVQHTPDLSAISDALRILQTEAKAAANKNAQILSDIKNELKGSTEVVRQSTTATQQNTNTGEEARAAATKWARTKETQSARATPAIEHRETQREITEPSDKAKLFKDVFLPTPPQANLQDFHDAEYSDRIELPPVTEKEIEDAISAASPLKGPGPDGITNKALQAGRPQLTAHMLRIVNQSIKLGYCPPTSEEPSQRYFVN
ncbi:zinc knuckle [Paraphaeosphaeria sporulosa]